MVLPQVTSLISLFPILLVDCSDPLISAYTQHYLGKLNVVSYSILKVMGTEVISLDARGGDKVKHLKQGILDPQRWDSLLSNKAEMAKEKKNLKVGIWW